MRVALTLLSVFGLKQLITGMFYMILMRLFIRHLIKKESDSLSHNLLCTRLQNNNIIKYGTVLIRGFPCLAAMPEKCFHVPLCDAGMVAEA